jgi:hypothetical protein
MRAKKVKRPSKERRGLSRPALDRELVILTERLLDQVWLASPLMPRTGNTSSLSTDCARCSGCRSKP